MSDLATSESSGRAGTPWRRRLEIAGTLGTLLLLAWASWPLGERPVLFWDSHFYLRWPAPTGLAGARAPGYPLVLWLLGSGAVLSHVQTWLSLASFAGLGWLLARWPGLVVAGLLALSPAIRFWNEAVLAESLTLSLLVVLLGLGLRSARAASWRLLGTWCAVAALFGALRDANALLLPFLLVPFLYQRRAMLAVAAAVTVCVLAASALDAQRNERWKTNYYTAFMSRVAPDPEARAHFRALGMPARPFREDRAAFLRWLDAHGSTAYPAWVLTRPASYVTPWRWLLRADYAAALERKYFASRAAAAPPLGGLADAVFRITALPLGLWLAVLCLPLVQWRRHGRIGMPALWTLALGAGTLVQAFATYHGSGSGELRHMLAAAVLYRLVPAFSLAALYAGRRAPRAGT